MAARRPPQPGGTGSKREGGGRRRGPLPAGEEAADGCVRGPPLSIKHACVHTCMPWATWVRSVNVRGASCMPSSFLLHTHARVCPPQSIDRSITSDSVGVATLEAGKRKPPAIAPGPAVPSRLQGWDMRNDDDDDDGNEEDEEQPRVASAPASGGSRGSGRSEGDGSGGGGGASAIAGPATPVTGAIKRWSGGPTAAGGGSPRAAGEGFGRSRGGLNDSISVGIGQGGG